MFTFAQILGWLLHYKYLILFPLSIAEGPIIMVLSGFLYRLGYFELIPAYVVLMLGDLVGDFFWYGVGYFGARPLIRKHGKFLGITEEIFEKIQTKFRSHQGRILLVSKLTMGFGFALATLVTAGASKVPFRKYAFLNFFGGLAWTAFLLGVGYSFGNLYAVINREFQLASLVFLATVLAGALYGFSRHMRMRLLQNRL